MGPVAVWRLCRWRNLPGVFRNGQPISFVTDIVIETLPGMNQPSIKSFKKKRGVLAWNFGLELKAGKVLKHGGSMTCRRG